MLFERLREDEAGCGYRSSADGDRLVVDADACEQGDLARSPGCRAAVVGALADTAVDTVLVRAGGRERAYEEAGAALLAAAGRFVERAAFHDDTLADRARRDPLAAGRDAAGRAGPVADIARETGLAAIAARFEEYGAALRPYVGPTVADSRVTRRPTRDSSSAAPTAARGCTSARARNCGPTTSSPSSGASTTTRWRRWPTPTGRSRTGPSRAASAPPVGRSGRWPGPGTPSRR